MFSPHYFNCKLSTLSEECKNRETMEQNSDNHSSDDDQKDLETIKEYTPETVILIT